MFVIVCGRKSQVQQSEEAAKNQAGCCSERRKKEKYRKKIAVEISLKFRGYPETCRGSDAASLESTLVVFVLNWECVLLSVGAFVSYQCTGRFASSVCHIVDVRCCECTPFIMRAVRTANGTGNKGETRTLLAPLKCDVTKAGIPLPHPTSSTAYGRH